MTTVEQQAGSAVRPFTLTFPEEALADLRRRLATTRWPPREIVDDASQGVQTATLQALVQYWAGEYDLGRVAARLNALPQFTTGIDGVDVHFLHVRSPHPDALPLVITHGSPGSVVEMLEVIGPLTAPPAHGGSAEDAFHVVVPSIPGYGLSSAPGEVGWGRLAPEGLLGIHLNFLGSYPIEVLAAVFGGGPGHEGLLKRVGVAVVANRADKEQEALDAVTGVFRRGYIAEMGEHPQTLGYAMAESPAGLAAWMLDHDADSYAKISRAFLDGQPTGGLTREHVLGNITLYWPTNTRTSSARLYWEYTRDVNAAAAGPKPPGPELPVAFTVFPGELFRTPRHWAEKVYPNLGYFHQADRGGHFAAWEEPEVFAAELRQVFRPLRARQVPGPRG